MLSTQKQAASALKAAAMATLSGQNSLGKLNTVGQGATIKVPTAGTLKFAGEPIDRPAVVVDTIWDEPGPPNLQEIQLQTLGNTVTAMAPKVDSLTQMKADRRAMMDATHERLAAKAEATNTEMENKLKEIGGQIEVFITEWRSTLTGTMDELDSFIEKRVSSMAERYEKLTARARTVQRDIEEEVAERVRATEEVLAPVRRQLERIEVEIGREQQVRHNREEELMNHLEETVKKLEFNAEVECKNRLTRHEEAYKDFDYEFKRLRDKRHKELKERADTLAQDLRNDLDSESKLRTQGQDHITEEIAKFIHRFQLHVKEEGAMGN